DRLGADEGLDEEIEKAVAGRKARLFAPASANCPACGSGVTPGKKFCPDCGHKL
ncbi:MAG: hypothetical protein FJW35_01180, partial [Acidobacteria bacterium]|nr:hypothetical protein [Acidobacteriota bacterium]